MEVNEIHAIIKKLPLEFTSHAVIKAYIRKYEPDYGGKVTAKKGTFQNLNSTIGRFLSIHQKELRIVKKAQKVYSENLKGYKSLVANWENHNK